MVPAGPITQVAYYYLKDSITYTYINGNSGGAWGTILATQ